MQEDPVPCKSGQAERLPDRGYGMSGRMYRGRGNKYPGRKGQEESGDFRQELDQGGSGKRAGRDRIEISKKVQVSNSTREQFLKRECSFSCVPVLGHRRLFGDKREPTESIGTVFPLQKRI